VLPGNDGLLARPDLRGDLPRPGPVGGQLHDAGPLRQTRPDRR